MGALMKLLLFATTLILITETFVAGECPTVSQTYSCSPKCADNYECTHGKLCCPNSCHTKSCVEPGKYGGAGAGSNKDKSGGAGSYCGNVKCSPFETCRMDKSTNRMKCMRT